MHTLFARFPRFSSKVVLGTEASPFGDGLCAAPPGYLRQKVQLCNGLSRTETCRAKNGHGDRTFEIPALSVKDALNETSFKQQSLFSFPKRK